MNWSPRVKPIKIRQLYRYARLGIYDDLLLHDVGWELYARCTDIATVADVYREGRVPCPKCSTKIKRRIDPLFSTGEGGTHENWFRCTHCAKRLLWRDCRQALRDIPRCFDCRAVLHKEVALRCACGKTWSQEAYNQSVRTRVLLPCPHCFDLVRRPDPPSTKRSNCQGSEIKLLRYNARSAKRSLSTSTAISNVQPAVTNAGGGLPQESKKERRKTRMSEL